MEAEDVQVIGQSKTLVHCMYGTVQGPRALMNLSFCNWLMEIITTEWHMWFAEYLGWLVRLMHVYTGNSLEL